MLVHAQTAFLDGEVTTLPLGRDVSSATISHAHAPLERAMSVSGPRPDFGLSPPAKGMELPPLAAPAVLPVHGPSAGFAHLLRQPAFHRRHILSVKQFGHRDVHELFALAHEMQRRDVQFGLISICAQGGLGYAMVLERR